MKLDVLALRDVKAETFGPLMAVPSVGALVRELTDVVNNPASDEMIRKHPRDFQLMRIGSFDNASGVFAPLALPEFVLDIAVLAEGQGGSAATVARAA